VFVGRKRAGSFTPDELRRPEADEPREDAARRLQAELVEERGGRAGRRRLRRKR
jgi:hypothetical protein